MNKNKEILLIFFLMVSFIFGLHVFMLNIHNILLKYGFEAFYDATSWYYTFFLSGLHDWLVLIGYDFDRLHHNGIEVIIIAVLNIIGLSLIENNKVTVKYKYFIVAQVIWLWYILFSCLISDLFIMVGISGTLLSFLALNSLAFTIFTIWIICIHRIFTKTGNPGWASIIPIYNLIVLLKIVNRPLWWIILFFIPLVNMAIAVIIAIDTAKSFGKSDGFGVGIILLGFIFLPILAFSDAKYTPLIRKPMNIDFDNSNNSPDEIKKYKELLDSGAITQEEYDAKKKELLGL